MENICLLWAGQHDSSESKKLWIYPTIPGNFVFRIHTEHANEVVKISCALLLHFML